MNCPKCLTKLNYSVGGFRSPIERLMPKSIVDMLIQNNSRVFEPEGEVWVFLLTLVYNHFLHSNLVEYYFFKDISKVQFAVKGSNKYYELLHFLKHVLLFDPLYVRRQLDLQVRIIFLFFLDFILEYSDRIIQSFL